MKEVFEKLKGRLEIESDNADDKIIEKVLIEDMRYWDGYGDGVDKAIEIVNQVAEECKDSEILNLVKMNADFQNAKLEELKNLSKKLTSSDDGWISLPKVAFNRMIARMESESEKDWNDEEWFINVVDAARIMREIVKEYSDSENPNKSDDGWIPVSSGKMPENGRRCWVTYEWANGSLHVDKDYLVNGKWFETEDEAVKAWMYNDEETPAPYKPKGEK